MPRLTHKLLALFGLIAGLTACSGQKLLNTLTVPSGYTTANNVSFDPATGLKLDVYIPDGARNAPVVVFFYGGRWSEGDREGYKFVGAALAKQGFIAVVPDYRLYPKVRFPSFLEDSAKAVRWTRDHIQSYGGDLGRLFVMGHSAGAYNAAMLTVDPRWLNNVGGDRSWIAGMIGLAGPYDFLPITAPDLATIFGPESNYPNTQPINYADGKGPPMLLLHGQDDDAVWIKNSRNMAARVNQYGGKAELIVFPDMGHVKIIATVAQPLQGRSDVMAYVVDFVLRKSGLKIDRGPQPLPSSGVGL